MSSLMTMSPPARKPGFAQGIMLLLPITMAVMGISVLAPVVPMLLQHFKDVPNHEYLVQGGVLTMPAIWVLLFSPVAGWIADRFGRRRILMVSMVVYAFVGILPAFLDNLYEIILSRVGVGICESVVLTVSTTMICDYYRGRARERWLASQTAVASVSATGIIFLGGELGGAYGWRGPFFLYAYSLLLVLGMAALIWEPAPTDGAAADASAADLQEVRFHVFPWARMLGICAITLLGSISFYTVITKNAEALVALGVTDPAQIGKLTMLASIGVPIGTFVYWGASRLPIAWLLCLDFALLGIGFSWMGRAGSPSVYIAGSFINQLGCGLVLPTLLVWAQRGLAYEIRGRGNGVWQATFCIGQFLSGMTITFLAARLHGLLPTLVAMGALALAVAAIAALAAVLTRNNTPRAAPLRAL
jgi:predicted MFS family arabinose efflux permease